MKTALIAAIVSISIIVGKGLVASAFTSDLGPQCNAAGGHFVVTATREGVCIDRRTIIAPDAYRTDRVGS